MEKNHHSVLVSKMLLLHHTSSFKTHLCASFCPPCLLAPPNVQHKNCRQLLHAQPGSCHMLFFPPQPHYATVHMHYSANKHAISCDFIPKLSLYAFRC